jgi:hypothetical protein
MNFDDLRAMFSAGTGMTRLVMHMDWRLSFTPQRYQTCAHLSAACHADITLAPFKGERAG